MNSIMKKSLGFVLVLFLMVFSLSTVVKVKATEQTAIYTITSKTAVSTSGTTPDGSSASYSQTYNNAAKQMTSGNSMTLTLTGYSGYRIKRITFSMRSNASAGAGNLIVTAGSTTLFQIATANFNSSSWYGSYSSSYVNLPKNMTNDTYMIGNDEDVTITISATTNSLYCESFTILYDNEAAPEKSLSSISLNKESTTLKPGLTDNLSVTFDPSDATNKTIHWISSNPSIATVSDNGVVTAISGGSVTITADPDDDNADSVTCQVTVNPYSAPAISNGNYNIVGYNAAGLYQLSGIGAGDLGTGLLYDTMPDSSVYPISVESGPYENTVLLRQNSYYLSYSGNDNKLFTSNEVNANSCWTIIQDGNYYNVSNVAISNRTLKFNYNSGNVRFACYTGDSSSYLSFVPISSDPLVVISTEGNATELFFGNTLALNFATQNIDEPHTVTWDSSNTSAATIDSSGVLHPVALGKTIITATVNGTDSNSIEIFVLPNPSESINIETANQIADVVESTGTSQSYVVDGLLFHIDDDPNNIALKDSDDLSKTITIYMRSHGYTNTIDNTYVRVVGKIKKYNSTNEFTDATITKLFIVTFDSDGGSAVASQKVLDGAKATRPTPDPTKDGFTFNGWNNGNVGWDFNNDTIEDNITLTAQWAGSTIGNIINLLNSTEAFMSLAYKYSRVYTNKIDTLTRVLTGVSGTSYVGWADKKSVTDTLYSGNTAGGNNSIQLRSSGNSGIICNGSGYARKITIIFNDNTVADRKLDIYGTNTPYSSSADLYSNGTKGTLLGSIIKGTSTELTITGDYRYIGIRSNDGAIYADSIEIQWYGLYEYDDCDFRLRCGFDNSSFATDLAAISGDATYGIEVSTSTKTSRYASTNEYVKTSGDMKYVLIDLGDALTNADRLDMDFTVKVYVELDEVRYYATNDAMTKTYSVASMVNTYYANDEVKPLILNLYNLLVSLGKINN